MNNRRHMQQTLRQLEVEEFRKFMGPEMVGSFTNGEVMQLKREMETMADILIELYIIRREQEKLPKEEASGSGASTAEAGTPESIRGE